MLPQTRRYSGRPNDGPPVIVLPSAADRFDFPEQYPVFFDCSLCTASHHSEDGVRIDVKVGACRICELKKVQLTI